MKKQLEDQHFLENLGQHIRLIRETKNLSQEALAFQCGLHRTYIGAVERGERNITILNLKRVAQALDLPISKLLELNSINREE